MSRWEPNARGRLEQAALELYLEQGFDRTTVVEIAARAGLTERTFFRHFADKREVLFAGAGELRERLVGGVIDAPLSVPPMEAVAGALESLAQMFHARRDLVLPRHRVISANPELQERELIKMAGLAQALTDARRRRGVADPAARLSAEAAIAVFRVAFERWVSGPERADLASLVRSSLEELRGAVAAD